MVDDLSAKGKLKNCIAVCDVSGSMSGEPMDVCVALGLLLSELSEHPWGGKVITFSDNPQLLKVEGDDFRSKTLFIKHMDWGCSTDFQKVFDMILEVAIAGKLSAENMIKKIFVFSDMEFNEARGTGGYMHGYGYGSMYNHGHGSLYNPYNHGYGSMYNHGYGSMYNHEYGYMYNHGYGYAEREDNWNTNYEVIKRRFEESGYQVPKMVFWNLRHSNATPVESDKKGVALVGGYSKNLITLFLDDQEFVAEGPEAVMELALSGPEYKELALSVQEDEEVEEVPVNELDFARTIKLISPSADYSKDLDVDFISKDNALIKDVNGGMVAGGTDIDANDAGHGDGSSKCSDCLSLSEAQEEGMLIVESREWKDDLCFSENFINSPVPEGRDANSLALDKFDQLSNEIKTSDNRSCSFLHLDLQTTNENTVDSTSSRLGDLSLKFEDLSIKVEKRKKEEEAIEKSTLEEVVIVISDDENDPVLISSSSESSSVSEVVAYRGNQSSHITYGRAASTQDLEDDEPFVLNGVNSKFILSGRVARILYPHQTSGLRWLWSLHTQGKGGILGDDMGLGKTMQICSFLAGLFQSRLVKRVLIVAPKTLLSHNWVKELTVVGLSKKIREYTGCVKEREDSLKHIFQKTGILLTS